MRDGALFCPRLAMLLPHGYYLNERTKCSCGGIVMQDWLDGWEPLSTSCSKLSLRRNTVPKLPSKALKDPTGEGRDSTNITGNARCCAGTLRGVEKWGDFPSAYELKLHCR